MLTMQLGAGAAYLIIVLTGGDVAPKAFVMQSQLSMLMVVSKAWKEICLRKESSYGF